MQHREGLECSAHHVMILTVAKVDLMRRLSGEKRPMMMCALYAMMHHLRERVIEDAKHQ